MTAPRIRVFQALDDSSIFATAYVDAKGKLLPVFTQHVGSTPEAAHKAAEDWWRAEQEKLNRPRPTPGRKAADDIFG